MGFWIFGGSPEQEPTQQEQAEAYNEYLDVRVEMIEASDNEVQWNALAQQADELRSIAYPEPEQQSSGGFFGWLFG